MRIKEDDIIKDYLNKVKSIEKHNESYHSKDAPTISDQNYDDIKKDLIDAIIIAIFNNTYYDNFIENRIVCWDADKA